MFTPTQLQNDPLLETDDALVADLGLALRTAACGYGFLGLVAVWFLAAISGIGLDLPSTWAWAAAVTIVIVALVVWYWSTVDRRYRDAGAYARTRSPRTLAFLDRERVLGLRGELGKWFGAALGGIVVVTFAAAVVAWFSGSRDAWPWLFVGLALALAYAYGFLALHLHLTERARDAAAQGVEDDESV